ncbi:MAG: sulfatase-like hydrolase/transferase [Prevotella sp.]|nr:sulfatase-like hydrolase/transferase [Prevotella sp.]
MKCRVSFLLKTYLWTVLVFIIAKVAFMLFCHEGHVFTIADVWQVITHGLTLDLSMSLYILIVPFLVCFVSIWWNKGKMLGRILSGYFVIIALALTLAFVADTSLYPFWGFKLDASCLQYLETPTEAMASISTGYLLTRLVAFLVIAALIYKGLPTFPISPSLNFSISPSLETIGYILIIPVLIIGIRGGLAESTTNIGQVYYSQDQFLNHSAVNPVFNFFASFEKTANNIVDYHFFDEAECAQLMEGLYDTTSVDSDTLLNTQRPNIVIVLMESAGSVFEGAMPRLAQLKQEGIDFTECYANSWRTDRGTVCTYSGYPSFPTSSVMKMPKKTDQLPGIASALQEQGYHTSYIYGGDINFTNMRGYLIATGWEQLTWMADYSLEEQQTAKWGVRDDITFNTLYDQIMQMAPGEHYLIGYSTLSTHEPWDVPIKQYDDEIENSFYYLDQCIGDFIDRMKATPQWKDLLIIFLPDHSRDFREINEMDQLRNKIPMVWVGGAVKAPRQIEQTCNQTDLTATLLGQLQLPHDAFRWSRDVMSRSYKYPFAVHNYNNGYSLVDSTGFMAYDLDSRRVIADKSTDSERLKRMGKAILQATTKDLKEK